MSAFWAMSRYGRLLWFFFPIMGMMIVGSYSALFAKSFGSNYYGKIIVIDPGHGGHDIGVRGIDSTQEKMIALSFSQILAAELQDSYQVLLTRDADYWMDLYSRTAVANQAAADIFISIHTSGGFLKQLRGMSLFYFKELSQLESKLTVQQPLTAETEEAFQPWDSLQNTHQAASKRLTRSIERRLRHDGKHRIHTTEGAPILVLRGAAMPAVLVEVGYLTNPLDEKRLLDKNVLKDLASRIGKGIDDFFEKNQ
ncbi:MAG: N-acetylmuramoyl-L-alanine amidase [Deltaproteobacteria bacterium]|nr:N-acetylmuramoyl-L-alanine amidase [Deltaproteobacteria bacterium]